MKKKMKKLTLAKETLQNLNRPELRRVAGATAFWECESISCISCDGLCGGESTNAVEACYCVESEGTRC